MAKFALVAPVPPPRQAPVGHKLQAPKLVHPNRQRLGGGACLVHTGVRRFMHIGDIKGS